MNKNEELLSAWLKMSSAIRNDRVPVELSFNEIHILNILYHSQMQGEMEINATELCNRTGLLKSQMNKVLTGLEKKGIVMRNRSDKDKRKIMIHLNEDKIDVYEKEHQRILHVVDQLISRLGEKKTETSIQLLNQISQYVTEILGDLS